MVKPNIVPSLPAYKKSAQFINLFLSPHKADFRVPGPKRSEPYLTMCIPKVTFSFPDSMYEHVKNQLIHSFILEVQQIIESCDLKDTPIFDLAHPITIKATFSFL